MNRFGKEIFLLLAFCTLSECGGSSGPNKPSTQAGECVDVLAEREPGDESECISKVACQYLSSNRNKTVSFSFVFNKSIDSATEISLEEQRRIQGCIRADLASKGIKTIDSDFLLDVEVIGTWDQILPARRLKRLANFTVGCATHETCDWCDTYEPASQECDSDPFCDVVGGHRLSMQANAMCVAVADKAEPIACIGGAYGCQERPAQYRAPDGSCFLSPEDCPEVEKRGFVKRQCFDDTLPRCQ